MQTQVAQWLQQKRQHLSSIRIAMLADRQGEREQMILSLAETKMLAEAFCEDSPNDHVYLQNGQYYILMDTPQGLWLVDAFSTEIYDEHFECRGN